MKQYDIFLESKAVGSAFVEPAGLYTQFHCRCAIPKEGIYRITAFYGKEQIDLGICVPDGSMYVAKAKVPTKYLNSCTPVFSVGTGIQFDTEFVPLDPLVRFERIQSLPDAKFCVQACRKGLLFGKY